MELSQVTAAYIEKVRAEAKANNNSVIVDSDQSDTFDKKTKSTAPSLNVYKPTLPKCNINFKGRDKAVILSTTLALGCAVGMLCLGRNNGNLRKKIANLNSLLENTDGIIQRPNVFKKTQQSASDFVNGMIPKADLDDANATIDTQRKMIEKLNQELKKLKDAITSVGMSEDELARASSERKKAYEDLIQDATLGWDYTSAPKPTVHKIYFIKKKIKFNAFPNASEADVQNGNFVSSLLEKLKAGEDIDIPLLAKSNTEEALKKASLASTDTSILQLGQWQPAGMKLAYGERTNWSNEKISRDILQNFYDANNYTLDGVGISIKKGLKGKYKVTIRGNGVFDCNSLLELGSGNKLNESPFNAGGFGEGSRVVVANMLGQGKTDRIRFASSDWEAVFSHNGESVTRQINKTDKILDGNFIEFETNDDGLVESVIKAINYFKNSNNPDFSNLTFENGNFGFKILKPGEKGNLYMTQRFEYLSDGQWDNGLDGISLVFKRKPDLEEFKTVTNKNFTTGRDRVKFNDEDITDLTRYFARDLSDEELISAISSTMPHWFSKTSQKDNNAVRAFTNGLIAEAGTRHLGIDFGDMKICVQDHEDEAARKFVTRIGYEIVPRKFALNAIGVDSVKEVLEMCSSHTSLEPTKLEIQKIKLLDSAANVVQNAIQDSYSSKIKSLYPLMKDSMEITFAGDVLNFLRQEFPNAALVKKYNSIGLSSKNSQEFIDDLMKFMDEQVANCDSLSSKEKLKLSQLIIQCMPGYGLSDELQQYVSQLQNLDLINAKDIAKPKFIFDRSKELAKNTLGEAIIDIKYGFDVERKYNGHWIDREHLEKGDFFDLLATWLHEISHKSGGDGTPEFTYKLTDLIEALNRAYSNSPDVAIEINAIRQVYDDLFKAVH